MQPEDEISDDEAMAGDPIDDGWDTDMLGYHDGGLEPEPEGGH